LTQKNTFSGRMVFTQNIIDHTVTKAVGIGDD